VIPRAAVFVRVVALSLLAVVGQAAESPVSRCADCHFANPNAAWRFHLSEWDHSAHGRANVGCERCHGGDPSTFESFLAHQGMLSSQNPASPIHRANLPKTCGACHPAAFAAFQKSRNYELLREGNRETPTCVTCHGNVAAFLLSPKALAGECNRCHGASKAAPRTDYPAEGKILLTSVRDVRQTLDEADKLIRKVKDKARRADLEAELRDARAPITEAVLSAHMFVFGPMQERLEVARKRAELLMELLANPQSPPGK
jgi:hypothetical protein